MLLSGIGPSAELAAHSIDTVNDLSGIGKNLQDHPTVFLTSEVDPILSEIHAFESDTQGVLRARQQWLATGTGPLTHHNGSIFGAFLKLPYLESSAEFKALDLRTQAHISKPTVPHYEIANASILLPPDYPVPKDSAYVTPLAILMNPQSHGEVTLRSADPTAAPLIDLKLLDHPYDRKTMINLIRETMKFQYDSAIGKYFKRYILGPKSDSDEDILVCTPLEMKTKTRHNSRTLTVAA
jgi:choline dehydrogenase-like flavoprotein